MQRIDENTYIDDTLITCAEYQLFIDEMRSSMSGPRPHYWNEDQFIPGQAQAPVLGVSSSDAQAFCSWITAKNQGEWQFRLPTFHEANQHSLPNLVTSPLGYWINNANYDPEFYWINTGDPPRFSRDLLLLNYQVVFEIQADKIVNLFAGHSTFITINASIDQSLADLLGYIEKLAQGLFDKIPIRGYPRLSESDFESNRQKGLEILQSVERAIKSADKLHAKGEWAVDGTNPDYPLRYDEIASYLRKKPLAYAKILAGLLNFMSTDKSLGIKKLNSFQRVPIPNFTIRSVDEVVDLHCETSKVEYYASDFDNYLNLAIDIMSRAERLSGRYPAFEGIRLVKERIR